MKHRNTEEWGHQEVVKGKKNKGRKLRNKIEQWLGKFTGKPNHTVIQHWKESILSGWHPKIKNEHVISSFCDYWGVKQEIP